MSIYIIYIIDYIMKKDSKKNYGIYVFHKKEKLEYLIVEFCHNVSLPPP